VLTADFFCSYYRWFTSPTTVNAFYSASTNQISEYLTSESPYKVPVWEIMYQASDNIRTVCVFVTENQNLQPGNSAVRHLK